MSLLTSRPSKPDRVAVDFRRVSLSRAMGTVQLAWPFTPFDQDGLEEFIEQWIGWFVDAAQGNLRSPSLMPERNPDNSWRR